MIERWLTLSQKMESKQQSQIHSAYLLERLSRALVPLVFVKAFATQENLKKYSPQ
jgi:hypothetical protein